MILSIVFKPCEKGTGGFYVHNSTKVLLRLSRSVSTMEEVSTLIDDSYLELFNAGHRGLVHVQFYEYCKRGEIIKGYKAFRDNHLKYLKVLDLCSTGIV